MAYESESQKECQDILDSIDDMLKLELPKENPSSSFDHNRPVEASSNRMMIPQVDGSNDDKFSSPFASLAGNSSVAEINSEYKRASEYLVLDNADTGIVSTDKRNKQWGSLPFSMTSKVNNDGEHAALHVTHLFESEIGDSSHSDYSTKNEVRNNACIIRNMGESASDSKEVHGLVSCSLRDLMRRKRSYRVEHAERESRTTKKLLLDRHEGPNTCLWQKQLDLKTMQTDEEEIELQKNCDNKTNNHDNLACGKPLLPAGSDSFLQVSMPKDEYFGQHEMECLEASTVLSYSTNAGSSSMHGGPSPHKLETSCFIDSIDQSVACRDKNLEVGTAYAKTVASDTYIPNPFLDTLLRTDADRKVPEKCQQTDSAASSSGQSSSIDDKVSGKHKCMDKSSCGSICLMQHDHIKSYEHAVGKSVASDTQVLQSEKVENQKLGKNFLCETIGSGPIADDLEDNHMKLTEITIDKNPSSDKNLESNLSLPTFSDTHLHLYEEDEMPGFNDTFLTQFPLFFRLTLFVIRIEWVLGLVFSIDVFW